MSEIRVDNITDEAGTGKPGFPNGITATGAALTDPEITGGIYLGGTGSANYLDDYEEGTFSPTITSQTAALSGQDISGNATYTKIGDLVHIQFDISLNTVGTGSNNSAYITNLPFVSAASAGRAQIFLGFRGSLGTNVIHMGADINPSANFADIYALSSASSGVNRNGVLNLFNDGTRIMGSATYKAS